EGSAIHRERREPRVRWLPARSTRQARRELRPDANAHRAPGEMTSLQAKPKRLGVGFIGSGFNARFHMLGWRGVRDGDVLGVWSPNKKNATSAAEYARTLDVGEAKAYASITDMVADPAIDAIWLTGPNQARIENVEEIVHAIESG